jgi:hypothetical protein
MAGWGAPAFGQVDQHRAAAYFAEARAMCERDGGRLWGVSLCGPMVFADAPSGAMATNQEPPAGERPRVLGFANTAVDWGGTRWASYIWAFVPADDEVRRKQLLMHELFHRVQPELGLLQGAGSNDHLDTLEGRYWLRLEWRALARAISTPASRREAVRDALAFRAARRALFPGAAERERVEEMNEGLAQYTGTVLAASSGREAASSAAAQLGAAEAQATFVRTFAYASGVGYGVLLDAASPGWRRPPLATADLGSLLSAALAVGPSPSATAAAARYDGGQLRAAEEERDAQQRAKVAQLRQKFVEGPVLRFPRGRGGAVFETRGVTPIGVGTVFSSYRVAGPWGAFETTSGVLVSTDGSTLVVAAPPGPHGRTLHGDGWSLTLADGWVVRAGPRAGDLQVVRERE